MKNLIKCLPLLFSITLVYAGSNKPLIVTWGTVEAIQSAGYVVVNFQTLNETDNDFFLIERSDDSTAWSPVGTMGSVGDSNNPTNYSFTDSTANITQMYYYRIRQTDLSSSFTYSPGFIYDPFAGIEETWSKMEVRVFPNPVVQLVTITWDQAYLNDYEVVLLDMNGKMVLKRAVNYANIITLDLGNLSAATYIFQLQFHGQVVGAGRITKE